jgi:hypothetical protein
MWLIQQQFKHPTEQNVTLKLKILVIEKKKEKKKSQNS